MRAWFLVLSLILCCVVAQEPSTESPPCGSEHPLVGQRFELSTLQHDVAGTVVVTSDCTFGIENFVYDGEGPAVYVYGFSEKLTSNGEVPLGTIETIMDELPQGVVYDGTETLPVTLPADRTLDDILVLSVWCEAFEIDFGSAVLETA